VDGWVGDEDDQCCLIVTCCVTVCRTRMLICRSWVFARAWSLLSECRWNWTYSKQAIMEQMSVTFLFLPSPNSKLSLSLSLSLSLIFQQHSFPFFTLFVLQFQLQICPPYPPRCPSSSSLLNSFLCFCSKFLSSVVFYTIRTLHLLNNFPSSSFNN